MSRRAIEGARWSSADEYPAFQYWADELESILGFLDAHGQLDAFTSRFRNSAPEHRGAALAEGRAAIFLSSLGFHVIEWEPVAVCSRPGDFTVMHEGAAIFVEVKAPTWQGELARELTNANPERREWILQRIAREKFIEAEARVVNPHAVVIDIIERNAVPKLAGDRSNMVVIVDDLFHGPVGNPLTVGRFEQAFRERTVLQTVSAVVMLAPNKNDPHHYESEFVVNQHAVPLCVLPAAAARLLAETAASSAAARAQRFAQWKTGSILLDDPNER